MKNLFLIFIFVGMMIPTLLGQPFSISGSFIYNNDASTPMDNVKVVLMLNGIPIDSTTTSGSGYYQFTGLTDNAYSIEAFSTKPWGGVNATDAIKVKRRFSALDTFFLRGNWTFAKPSGGDTVIINGVNVLQNFEGLCVGDVNGSNVPVPNVFFPEPPGCPGSGDTIWLVGGINNVPNLVEMENDGITEVIPGQEFELPIKVKTDLSLSAISLVIPYTSEYLSILSVLSVLPDPFYNITNDQVRFAWSDLKPINLKKGETLLTLKLMAKGSFTGNQVFGFHPTYESELADEKGNILPTTSLVSHLISLVKPIGVEDSNLLVTSLKVYPNPAVDYVTIEIDLNHDASAVINLINVPGNKVMHLQHLSFKTGKNRIRLNLEGMNNGLYYISMGIYKDDQYIQFTKKIIINR